MELRDLIIGVIVGVFFFYFLWFMFTRKPSDKYHNDSWRKK